MSAIYADWYAENYKSHQQFLEKYISTEVDTILFSHKMTLGVTGRTLGLWAKSPISHWQFLYTQEAMHINKRFNSV